MCLTCVRTSGFQGGILAVSWRFWSLTSGSHTPLRSGGSAEAGEMTSSPASTAARHEIARFFAIIVALTGRFFRRVLSASLRLRVRAGGRNNLVRHILMTAIAKERPAAARDFTISGDA